MFYRPPVKLTMSLESFERLKVISERSKKPMTELLDEAIELLAQHYSVPSEAPQEDK
jgi:predicted DNA-binding protein